jgi:acyl-CoA thioester hydrolase
VSQTYSETMRVRFRDTDSQGHMFFANYLVFADEVAGNYMRTLGFDWSDPENLPSFVFTVNVNCDYHQECLAGQDVRVDVAYRKLGNTSATLGFSLTRVGDGQALASGVFTQVFVDPATRKPILVPEAIREVLQGVIEA